VTEIVLQRAGIVAIVGELEAAGVAQHVWMDRERHLGGRAEPAHDSRAIGSPNNRELFLAGQGMRGR